LNLVGVDMVGEKKHFPLLIKTIKDIREEEKNNLKTKFKARLVFAKKIILLFFILMKNYQNLLLSPNFFYHTLNVSRPDKNFKIIMLFCLFYKYLCQ